MAEALVEKAAEIIQRYNMTAAGDRIGVGVSGGADSVALLHILNRLSFRYQITLAVLHVNHHLRGEESEADEQFVRRLAESMGWPVFVRSGKVGESNQEAEARDIRRAFFAECRLTHKLSRVALGHNRSDQAETVLHRLLRGTGPAGLSGMRFVTEDGLMRPLLATSREELRRWATENGIAWREDSSNDDPRFTRNRLRHTTLPALVRDYNPNLEAVLAGAAQVAQAEEEYWDIAVESAYSEITKRTRLGVILAVEKLKKNPLAMRRRVLRRALLEIRANRLQGIDFYHISAILQLCDSRHGHDRVAIPGAEALRSFDSLLLAAAGKLNSEPRQYAVEMELGRVHTLPFGAGQICVKVVKPETSVCDKFKEDQELEVEQAALAREALARGPLLVRNWQPGDELHRPGHRSAEKVKTLFQEHRVLLWERRHWPVLLCGKEVAWVRGFGVAETFRETGRNPARVELVYRTGNCVPA